MKLQTILEAVQDSTERDFSVSAGDKEAGKAQYGFNMTAASKTEAWKKAKERIKFSDKIYNVEEQDGEIKELYQKQAKSRLENILNFSNIATSFPNFKTKYERQLKQATTYRAQQEVLDAAMNELKPNVITKKAMWNKDQEHNEQIDKKEGWMKGKKDKVPEHRAGVPDKDLYKKHVN